jgi:Protein of unknown function (DUF2934)
MPFFTETLHHGHLHRTPANFERRSPMELNAPRVAARTPTHEEIAALAYSYWEARGRQHGSALQDWLRAEDELNRRGRL